MSIRSQMRRDAREIGPCVYVPSEVRQLNARALVLLMDLVGACSDVRNGNLTATYSGLRSSSPDACSSPSTVRRIVRELIAAGFLRRTSSKPGRPHTYALTWVDMGRPHKPTHSIYPSARWKALHIPKPNRRLR